MIWIRFSIFRIRFKRSLELSRFGQLQAQVSDPCFGDSNISTDIIVMSTLESEERALLRPLQNYRSR
jgi:hypothetical protein